MRADLDPVRDDFGGEPAGRVDFGPLQGEGAFTVVTVDPDEFLAGFGAGGDFEEAFRGGFGFAADFFAKFALGARVIFLAAIEVAGGGGIPGARKTIFGHGTFLKEQFATRVEDEDVNGAMF